MSAVEVRRGSSPVILGFPHAAIGLPTAIRERLNQTGRLLADTDWHIDRLYAGLLPDATTVKATFHRYVIDANRDPAGTSLYPGRNTTGLVPTTDFAGVAIWRDGAAPTPSDIAERLATYHEPYHQALASEIARVKALHGVAILYDCHSIRSVLPFLFDGILPDLNIGTAGGTTCDPRITAATIRACRDAPGASSVLDGRFKGGWTTRHYGKSQTGVHAIQMEIAQSAYLASEEPPFAYDTGRAERLRAVLGPLLAGLEALAPELAQGPAR